MKKDLLKFPLKRVLLSTVILCSLSAIISSCGEEEGRISVNDAAPEKVTNVTTKAGPGEVTLSWTNPASSSFMYTKIEYTNAKGEKKYELISKERGSTATIKGFANTDVQSFHCLPAL